MDRQERDILKKRDHQRQRQKELAKADRIRKNKLTLLGVVSCLVLVGLMGRVFYIKSVYGNEYERRAAEQEFNRKDTQLTIAANRGNIMDRNMQSLAISYSVDNIIMDIRNLADEKEDVQKKTLENLNTHLGIPMETLTGYLAVDENGKLIKDLNYYIIAKKVPRQTTLALMESGVKCIYSEEGTMRSYVHNDLASQVIGFVWGDTSWGIERKYDELLTGTSGRMFKYRDDEKNIVTERRVDAINGYSLVTTLDMTIQQFAEDAVLQAVEEYEPENASVIVMNPQTGEVLAMAQYPAFNLNDPDNILEVSGQKFKTEYEALEEADRLDKLNTMWVNFNLTRTFEPGSIFKPMVVAAALEENIITPASGFNCNGHKQVLDWDINCWIRTTKGSHGSQTLTQVLANSCNVGLMDIAEKMGRDVFFKYQHDFGYGEKTGIDLPGEGGDSSVLLHQLSALNPTELATSSMGQSFNNTPIQAINAFSAVINGGNLMKPYIVAQVIDDNGNVIKENTPTVQRKVISQETSDWMRIALQAVVTPEGTGKKAIIEGYSIGGKTGTGEQSVRGSNLHTVSFVGYLPAENPEIIAIAIIDRPKEYIDGVTTAAPMLRSVLSNIIQYKGLLPTKEVSDEADINNGQDSILLEDFVGKSTSEVTKSLNNIGIDYEFVGSGNVINKQQPAGGIKVSSETTVYLYVSESPGTIQLALVPDVTGVSEDQAIKILSSANLTPIIFAEKQEQLSTDDSGTDIQSNAALSEQTEEIPQEETTRETPLNEQKIVYQQMPSADIRVEPGTEIKLKVK